MRRKTSTRDITTTSILKKYTISVLGNKLVDSVGIVYFIYFRDG